jgi:ribonuclease HI
VPGGSATDIVISCDGSSKGEGISGWGFTVAHASVVADFCGPSVLDPGHAAFVGVCRHSNNVGEVAAILFGLCWAAEFISQCTARGDLVPNIVLEYDSQYAADVIRRITRPRTNLTVIINARGVYDQVAEFISWRQVASHTGQFLSERADLLANCGANGIFSGRDDIIRWAKLVRRRSLCGFS